MNDDAYGTLADNQLKRSHYTRELVWFTDECWKYF